MGMFDYFEFKAVSHPNFKYKHYCLDFQTKSLDNLMQTYLLRGERLFIKDYDDVCSLTGGLSYYLQQKLLHRRSAGL